MSVDDKFVTDWCSRPSNYIGLIDLANVAKVPVKPKDESAAANGGVRRRMESSKETKYGATRVKTQHGITTTFSSVNQYDKILKISFERLFNQTNPDILDLAPETEYSMLINWGIFKNEND